MVEQLRRKLINKIKVLRQKGSTTGLLRFIPSVTFLGVLVCFSFPFIDVKCAGVKTTSFSGFQLARGLKINRTLLNFYNKTKLKELDEQENKKEIKEIDEAKLKVLIWLSIFSAASGMLFSLVKRFLLASISGSICFLALLLFWYSFSSLVSSAKDTVIEVRLATPFWIALFSSLIGSGFSFYARKRTSIDDRTPS